MAITFRVQLLGVSKPLIWRTIMVPNTATFREFHQAIQECFGWEDYHLWCFTQIQHSHDGWFVEYIDEDDDIPYLDEEQLRRVISPEKRITDVIGLKPFFYHYDYGDDWVCSVKIVSYDQKKLIGCYVTGGRGENPGEDIGGIPGLLDRRAGKSDFAEDDGDE